MTKGKQEKAEWPKKVRVGSFCATIYRASRQVRGETYHYFRIGYVEPGGRRVTRDFGSEERAREVAAEAVKAFAVGRPDALSFTPAERAEYDAAAKALLPTGATVYQAAVAYVENWAKRPTALETRTVEQIVKEHVADLKRRGASSSHQKNSAHYGKIFTEAFTGPLSEVTPESFRTWLWSQKRRDGKSAPSGRALFNLQNAFMGIVNFAARRKYISRALAAEFSDMEKPQPEPPKCGVFSVDDFRRLLEAADESTRPAFVLGGFCGLRMAELGRLLWSDVKIVERVVVVGAHVAKTQSRRVVPICAAAVEWLTPMVKESGPVLPVEPKMLIEVAKAAGVPWVRNGLRHSFCSYRLAITKNAAEVAFEAGNSPVMIQAHYRSLVTEAQGKAWFDIRPPTPANVITPTMATT